MFKITYTEGGTADPSDVPMIWKSGDRNFNTPQLDKIYKKIVSIHGSKDATPSGNVTISWETCCGTTGSWTFSLTEYPTRWESFFPDDAFGRCINIQIYKSDTYDYYQKELLFVYSAQPLII